MLTSIILATSVCWHGLDLPCWMGGRDLYLIPLNRRFHPPTREELVGPANPYEGIYRWRDEADA